MLNSKRDFSKDLERIKSLSSKIDKKISEVKSSDDKNIEKLTLEELQDLNKIVGIADFLLVKYADKKRCAQFSNICICDFRGCRLD